MILFPLSQPLNNNNNNNNKLLLTAIVLLPGGSGYFTCIQNMKLVTNKFKSRGLHEKHVVATWNLGKHLRICLWTQGNKEKPFDVLLTVHLSIFISVFNQLDAQYFCFK